MEIYNIKKAMVITKDLEKEIKEKARVIKLIPIYIFLLKSI